MIQLIINSKIFFKGLFLNFNICSYDSLIIRVPMIESILFNKLKYKI